MLRVGYYRALILVRNSAMIGLGLAHPPSGFDVVEMTMYQTSLMRGAALVICDCLGETRPAPALPEGDDAGAAAWLGLVSALRRDLDDVIRPTLTESVPERRAEAMARGLATLEHEGRVGAGLDRDELEDLGVLLGSVPGDRLQGEKALRRLVVDSDRPGEAEERRRARYFARRMGRLAERRRPLMGRLFDRLPQQLEDS